MVITHKLDMDLEGKEPTKWIEVAQGDACSRKIRLSLFSGQRQWIIPQNVTVLVRYRKPDGKCGEYDTMPDGTSAWHVKENEMTINLAPQVLTAAGKVMMYASMMLEGKVLNTFAIEVCVRAPAKKNNTSKVEASEDYFFVTGVMPAPEQAEAGQYIRVSRVDARGRVTQVVAVDLPTEGSVDADQVKQIVENYLEKNPPEAGKDGEPGKDGFSPVVQVTQTDNGIDITITDKNGTKLAKIINGKDGARGEKGDTGPAGPQGIPGVAQTPLFANTVEECTDITKVYVLPDGYIYGYTSVAAGPPEFVIEERTGGYWKTGPSFYSSPSYSSKNTNIVPVTPGDQIEYTGLGAYSAISVCWMDAGQKQIASEEINVNGWGQATKVLTAPEGAAYAQFYSYKQSTNVSDVTLKVVWILCQGGGSGTGWVNTGHAFVPADYEERIVDLEQEVERLQNAATSAVVNDVLAGKKIIYDGDSICQSDADAGGAYAGIIAEQTNGRYVNHAAGGARLCANSDIHSVVNNLANLPRDGDLYCFEGGINDWWANTPVGTYDRGSYTGTVDPATVYGAMETIFRYALTNFDGKPVCFVIVHKIQNSAYSKNNNGHTFWDYREAMINVCEKYSIPYYDAFTKSGLNGWNDAQNNAYLTANGSGMADGIHPNAEGYKRYYVPQLLSLFRSVMPV